MKRFIICMLVLVGVATSSLAEDPTPSEMSDKLRLMALNLKPDDIGLTKEKFPHPVFTVLMETGLSEGSYTLAVVADGTTSIYYSSGGGIVGAGQHDSVYEASGFLILEAQNALAKAKKTTEFPKPTTGQVIFYFVTVEDGVHSYTALEEDLGNEVDELSGLFLAAHRVISEVRAVQKDKPETSK